MTKTITVLGVEAEGIRGVRLEEDGAQWTVADSEFWSLGGGGAAGAPESDDMPDGGTSNSQPAMHGSQPSAASGEDEVEGPPSENRYEMMVAAVKDAAKRFGTREVVLSMPLKALLVNVARTAVEDRASLSEAAAEEIGKLSPFPDETPVAGIETVAETDSELVTVFAALPSAEASEIGDALDEAKVRVTRTDITALGWLRTLWPKVAAQGGNAGRTVVLMDFDDGWDVVVLDDGAPSLLRGLGRISDPAELCREVMLSLLKVGAAEVSEIVVFSKAEVDGALVERLKMFAPVRVEQICCAGANDGGDEAEEGADPAFGGIEGVARRTQEGATLDVTPADWAELRMEARFSKKLIAFLVVAAAGWGLLMGVLFGVPFVYGQMAERQKVLSKRHATAYREVKEMRDKVKLVQQYSDHARGSLEMLKAVSDRMPGGVTLTSFSYRRGERLSVVGEASQPTDVYEFKNALAEAATEDDEKLFTDVSLTGPSQSRGVHKFSIECSFVAEDEGK